MMNYDRSTDVTYTYVRRKCAKKGGGRVHGGDGDNEREKRKSHGVGGKRGRRVGKGKEHFGRGSGNVLIARTKVRCLVLRGNPPLPFLLLSFSFSSPSSSSFSDIYPSFSQFLPDFLPMLLPPSLSFFAFRSSPPIPSLDHRDAIRIFPRKNDERCCSKEKLDRRKVLDRKERARDPSMTEIRDYKIAKTVEEVGGDVICCDRTTKSASSEHGKESKPFEV